MKQKLLLLIALLIHLAGHAQDPLNNPARYGHYIVPCDTTLINPSCNLLPNPGFTCAGDSLESFSDGDVYLWQDINNLTTDINGALSTGMGWNLPTVPSILTGVNFASMLVDNEYKLTEGIAGKTFAFAGGHKYALSFFLSTSALSNFRTNGGTFTFKIYLKNCQNLNVTTSGNPDIEAEKQLIYCRAYENQGTSDWQQYFISFTSESDYNMIVVIPEVSDNSYDGGTYVHFLYPEIVPINPTSQYLTYLVPGGIDTSNINPVALPDSIHGITILSACGVLNGLYQWEGPNGIVSENVSDVLAFDVNIGENDEYTFSMWVEGAIGNDLEECEDAEPPIINEPSIQLPTTERVTCADHVTATNNCNIIPNAIFSKTPADAPNLHAFKLQFVDFWGSVNANTPDLNGGDNASLSPPPNPVNVPANAIAAGMYINDGPTSYTYEGIYAKIPKLYQYRKYAFSFFLNTKVAVNDGDPSNFTLNVALRNDCYQYPIEPGNIGTTSPPNLGTHQKILCQVFPGVSTIRWQQYFVTFTAEHDYEMIVIYPEGNLAGIGTSYIHILYPELVDVTNLASISQESACNYTVQACGVANATFEWVDGNNTVIGNTAQITVNSITNPYPYIVTVSVPNILNNPILDNTCSNNTESLEAIAFMNKATWIGGTTGNLTNWNTSTNWNPAVVPNSNVTDVFIPSFAPNQPTILSGTYQVHSIVLEPGATLINNGTLKIAGSITSDPSSIDNYNSTVVTGSIEMNGTCAAQKIAGNIFIGKDVKNFTASNNVSISSISGEGLDVHRELSFGAATSKTLITGGNLTLVSNATTTANVASIHSSNFIDGDVTVERHILTGLGSGEHAKTWQALATPTGANSTSQSIYDSWMEGGNNASTGYGTHIPDPRSTWAALGFDGPTANAITSIKTFDASMQNFASIAQTSDPLNNKHGYFLFVRGDRSVTDVGTAANPTNLRAKGALFQPHTGYAPPSVTAPGWTSSPQKYVMVGNPYASAINLEYMHTNTGYFSNLTDIFVVWDVSIPGTQGYGGYQYLDAGNNFEPTSAGPGGTTNYYQTGVSYPEIQSGQAFFVSATNNGSTGTVSFDENAKSGNSRIVTRMVNKSESKRLWAGLYSSTGICDGTSITFGNEYSNEIGSGDAEKLPNPGENFMICKANGVTLAIESRLHTPVKLTPSYRRKLTTCFAGEDFSIYV